MAAELVFAAEAEQDIAEGYAWYESERTGLGEAFLGCVEACLESIRRTPEMHVATGAWFSESSCRWLALLSGPSGTRARLQASGSSWTAGT